MATLFINRNDSRCGACNRNADPFESAHLNETMYGEGCGATYDAVSSDYSGVPGLYERIREMRPDLPFVGGAS
jgi:hypothetical protein